MKLSRLGEFGLIERLRRGLPAGRGVRIGVGDDAAWVENPSRSSLVSADMLIEGVHFDLKWTSLVDLGFKSLAVNLSDIAAMGGVPAYAVVCLGLPPHFDSGKLDDFYRGIHALARPSSVAVIGGDLSIATLLTISVCVIGHPPRRPIRRAGAAAGDDIYVTGTLGDSALGLKLLRRGGSVLRKKSRRPFAFAPSTSDSKNRCRRFDRKSASRHGHDRRKRRTAARPWAYLPGQRYGRGNSPR